MKSSEAYLDYPMSVPCGQCMGCRLAKTAEWATRIVHEAQCHELNSFITLTYSDENIPEYGTLVKEHLQKFFKKLRNYVLPEKIRYYACGEYGDITQRPHYHAIVFNYWPDDSRYHTTNNGNNLYVSEKLQKIWKYGHVLIGACTYETAAYTASYVTKKIKSNIERTGQDNNARFKYRNKIPEFSLMSRRPGIASEWYEKYREQTWTHDSVIARGMERKPPKYYMDKLKEENPVLAKKITLDRIRKKETWERMEVTEDFLVKKQKFFAKNNIT